MPSEQCFSFFRIQCKFSNLPLKDGLSFWKNRLSVHLLSQKSARVVRVVRIVGVVKVVGVVRMVTLLAEHYFVHYFGRGVGLDGLDVLWCFF